MGEAMPDAPVSQRDRGETRNRGDRPVRRRRRFPPATLRDESGRTGAAAAPSGPRLLHVRYSSLKVEIYSISASARPLTKASTCKPDADRFPPVNDVEHPCPPGYAVTIPGIRKAGGNEPYASTGSPAAIHSGMPSCSRRAAKPLARSLATASKDMTQ